MSRNGKITSSGPNGSTTYLRKAKWELSADPKRGRSTGIDVVKYNDAIKACSKAYNEGRVKALDDIILAINSLGFPKDFTEVHGCIIGKSNLETLLKTMKDKALGEKK